MFSRILFLIFFTFLYHSHITAQNTWHWVETFGDAEEERIYDIIVDDYDQIYVCGDFTGFISFGNTMSNTSNSYAPFLAKLDANGQGIWGTSLFNNQGNPTVGIFHQIDIYDNSIYVAGKSGGSYGDGFIKVITTNGQESSTINITGYRSSCNSITVRDANNIYATGTYNGEITAFNNSIPESDENFDMWVAKFDANGQDVWTAYSEVASFHDTYTEGFDIETDNNGNVYVLGSWRNGETKINGQDSGADYGIFLIKYSSSGNFNWVKYFPSTDYATPTPTDIVIVDNDIYLSGYCKQSIVFEPYILSSQGVQDNGFIVKLNLNGSVMWGKSIQSLGENQINSIATREDYIFVSGSFTGGFSYEGEYFEPSSITNEKSMFVGRLNDFGDAEYFNLAANETGGVSNYSYANTVAIDSDGAALVGGVFRRNITIDDTLLISAGLSNDILIGKFNCSIPNIEINTSSNQNTFCEGDVATLNPSINNPNQFNYQWLKDGSHIPDATSPNYNAPEEGSYQVILFTSDMFCSDTSDVFELEFFPNPEPFIQGFPFSDDNSYCDGGEPLTLYAQGGNFDSYLWSTGETTSSIQVSEATTVQVTITKNGCTATSAPYQVFTDTIPAQPQIEEIEGCKLLCLPEIQGDWRRYIWYRNGIELNYDSKVINAIPNSFYEVQISDDNYCLSELSEPHTANCSTVDVSYLNEEDYIKSYPNPSNGIFYIESNFDFNSLENIEIYDVTGRKISYNIYLISNTPSIFKIDLSYAESGLYFIKLNLNGHIETLRMILNH